MALVTTVVLVTTSTRSGRASRFLMVRRIGRAICRQPEPVGLGSVRRMPNHLGKIRTRHRCRDRLHGATPQTHRGNHTPTRTSPLSPADHPRHLLLGSRNDGSVPVKPPAGQKPYQSLTKTQQSRFIYTSTVVICHVRVSMLPLGHAESIAQAKGVYDGTADCGTCAGGY
jgi:hypothetical protein